MELRFKNNTIKKQCEDPGRAQRDFGVAIGIKLTQRVTELTAATKLWDIKLIPAARLHRLHGSRNDQYAVDLVHPFRLVFSPILREGVAIYDLKAIDLIRVEEVIEYHGKQKR